MSAGAPTPTACRMARCRGAHRQGGVGGLGMIGLLLALVVVGFLMVKQMRVVDEVLAPVGSSAPGAPQSTPAGASPSGNVAERSRQTQQQVREQLDQMMQQRPRDLDAATH